MKQTKITLKYNFILHRFGFLDINFFRPKVIGSVEIYLVSMINEEEILRFYHKISINYRNTTIIGHELFWKTFLSNDIRHSIF